MSYEFNAADKLSSDYQNPFIIENKFLLLSALIYGGGGIAVMAAARTYLRDHADGAAAVGFFLALSMLAIAVTLAIGALSQFRFMFGRGFPVGLAPELPHTKNGSSVAAEQLQQQMRDGAVLFQEPQGPLAGVLYALVRPLSTAPWTIQFAAQRHFEALIGMIGVFISLCASFTMFAGSPYEGLVSWAYLPIAAMMIRLAFINPQESQAPVDSRSTLVRLVAMLVFGMIGPVLLTRFMPGVAFAQVWAVPACMLVGAIGASGLFLAAVVARIDSVEQTAVSCEQTTIAMNCQPAQLWTAIDRDFQENWARGIPNRSYCRVLPQASETQGNFSGSVLEETQPVPTDIMEFTGMWQGLRAAHTRSLVLLGFWAVTMSTLASTVAWYCSARFAEIAKQDVARYVLLVIAFDLAMFLAFRIGHLLWSRMYFKSRLIWIEVQGTYQTAELDIGNQVTGNARSRSTVIRVEDATLRVWVTDIVSIAFGKAGRRFVMALAPADNMARSMAMRLKEFAAEQSMLLAPTSTRDVEKARVLDGIGQLMSAPGSAAVTLVQGVAASGDASSRSAPTPVAGNVPPK